jgi:ATP-dependent protease Clp ATPase subunit
MEIHIDPKIIEMTPKGEKKPSEENVSFSAPNSILNYNINDLISEISAKIVGQEDAIKTLVTNIYYNQLLIEKLSHDYHMDLAELDSRKVTILLDGPTGTGKTAILKDISSKLDLPITFCNANSFSETGYVGPSITDPLRKLYRLASNKISKAENGIIVFDEIDKICSRLNTDKDMKKGVQEELLGFISGGGYDFPLEDNKFGSDMIHFDTSKLTFILSGAFTNLRERKIAEIEKKHKNIGFTSKGELSEEERQYIITPQDYIDEGLNREFFGRIKVLACTRGYDYRDLLLILNNSTISPLKNFEKTANMFGYNNVYFTPEFIDQLINQALEMNTGARSLQTIMSGIQNRLLYGMINQEYNHDGVLEITPKELKEYNLSLVRRF